MEDPRMKPHLLGPVMQPPFPPLPQVQNRHAVGPFVPKKKIKIRWLEEDARRRETLRKRRSGIIKKAEELHILCDVQTCIVIFSPNDDQPEVFPSIEQAVEMCRRFKQLPEFNRGNLMHTNVQFIQEMVDKKNKKIWTKNDEINELETMSHIYSGLIGTYMESLDTELFRRAQATIQGLLNKLYNQCSILRYEAPSTPAPLELQEQPTINPLGLSAEDPATEDLVARFRCRDNIAPH